jgi:hypothetical protein
VYLEFACPDSTRQQQRPQPGEDGYGRLVRVQQGGAGMKIRMPSNRQITRTGPKSSAPSALPDGQDISELVQRAPRPNFLWGNSLRENYERGR